MAIRNKIENPNHPNPIIFRDSQLAHKYLDDLQGIEIGAAAHNPFNLKGCKSVGLKGKDSNDFFFFAEEQVKMCGNYVDIDIDAEADNLPLPDESQDYVLTSHVIEHLPNPIKAFQEWDRVLKNGGYIYMIVPKRGALPADAIRPYSTVEEFFRAYKEDWNVDTVPEEFMQYVPGGRRGHYWVFTPHMLAVLLWNMLLEHVAYWEVVEFLETDDKVGNGHLLIARKSKKLKEENLERNYLHART